MPRKWKDIQSLHLKTSESVALPLFASLPEIKQVIPLDATRTTTKKKTINSTTTHQQSQGKKKEPITNKQKKEKKVLISTNLKISKQKKNAIKNK